MLGGKNILLGVTGGIAAYKTPFLVRLLIKAGASVKVILTESAGSFVSPLTLATVSKNAVLTSFAEETEDTVDWNNHVELGLWADLMIIAPATANTLSKMANGICDNLLLAVYLSAKCPVFFAPSMDLDMYQHPATISSFEKLHAFGNNMIPAATGELASGLYGEGRMAEPEEIIEFIQDFLKKGLPLNGKKVLITSGPTYEAIDPVRFIANHSTGMMGYEMARSAAALGAGVVLISGPTHLSVEHPNIEVIHVVSATEMFTAAMGYFDNMDIVICAAAVADYRPKQVSDQKIKKVAKTISLELVRNPDILETMGQRKNKQYLLGFALETENEVANAKAKCSKKNLDAIVLNSLNEEGAGFGLTTNKISFIDNNSEIKTFDVKTKAAVARDIWNEIIRRKDA